MNYDITLSGKNEFYPGLNSKTYNILKVNTKQKENQMILIFNKFIENQNKNPNEKHFIGIDFEFNKISKGDRDVALMQINIENDSNVGYIFVLYPPELSNDNLLILKKLITHKKMFKVLHGAESLDIPYLFNQLLVDKELIDNFCINFYDTKYLCDYKNIENNETKRCSIYYLLVNNQVMTQNKLEELEKIEEKTGPIYLVHIDIHKLSHEIFKYSLYDVIYLPELLKKFQSQGLVYTNIIPEICCIVNKYKRNIEPEFIELEKVVNSLNICFIYDSNNIIKLNEIWTVYYNIIDDTRKIFNKLKRINYFKTFFEIITKLIVYNNLQKYFKIFLNRKDKVKPINFDKYFSWLSRYSEFYTIVKDYDRLIEEDIIKIIKRKD